jgi:hypothetical protein
MVKAPNVTAAKRIRALLDSHAVRQQKQDARLDLRKRIRDHGIALTARMDKERMRNVRADTPQTARTAAAMGGSMPSAVSSARAMSVATMPMSMASVRSAPMVVQLSPRSIARSASSSRAASTVPMSSRSGSQASVGSLVRQFEGLGYPGGYAPARRPARAERDLSRYKR